MVQRFRLIVLIFLVMLFAILGYRARFGDAPAHDLLVVSASSATVAGNAYQESVDLEPGQVIGVDHVVRTTQGGSAALQYGDGAQVMLGEVTVLRVLAADSKGVRIELDEGEVTARVRKGAPPLDVVSKSRSVIATDADFTVMVAKGGGMSVSAGRGEVQTRGFGQNGRLRPGMALHMDDDGTAAVAPISESLLLDVEWPEDEKTRLAEVEVTGRTDPYATVTVGTGAAAVRVRSDLSLIHL